MATDPVIHALSYANAPASHNKIPMVSSNRNNGIPCGWTFALDNNRPYVPMDGNSGINAFRLAFRLGLANRILPSKDTLK